MDKKYTLLLSLFLLFSACQSEESDNKIFSDKQIYESKSQDIAKIEQVEKLNKLNSEINNSRQNALTEAIKSASPAVVGINVTETKRVVYRDPFDDMFSRFFRRYRSRGRVREYEVKGVGTGFLISSDGYILTNHHVAGTATKVIVTLTGGEEYEAEIIGSDMRSDVALLKIEGDSFPYLKMCNSDILIGEWAIALGNPFGLFDKNAKPTVTVGVVSNNGVDFVQEEENEFRIYRNMIQTDAAISSGNSGGPLINALGEVIGMNTIIFSTATDTKGAGSIGIGFSILISRVMEIAHKLMDDQDLDRDYYLGIDVRRNNPRIQKYFDLDSDKGLYINGVSLDSPAYDAGLEPGDIILKIDDYKIFDDEDYILAVNDKFVGDTLNFLILRDGKESKHRIQLKSMKR